MEWTVFIDLEHPICRTLACSLVFVSDSKADCCSEYVMSVEFLFV